MKFRLITICAICMLLASGALASKIFIPMDATGQKNHLKAYGVAYAAMHQGIKVDWLLNYKGGSFALEYSYPANVRPVTGLGARRYRVLSQPAPARYQEPDGHPVASAAAYLYARWQVDR